MTQTCCLRRSYAIILALVEIFNFLHDFLKYIFVHFFLFWVLCLFGYCIIGLHFIEIRGIGFFLLWELWISVLYHTGYFGIRFYDIVHYGIGYYLILGALALVIMELVILSQWVFWQWVLWYWISLHVNLFMLCNSPDSSYS